MSIDPLDHPGEVFDLALMNPNPSSSKTKDGPVYRVSFEVERETWDLFMDADTKGMLIAAKAAVVAEEQPEATAANADKPKKGEFGKEARDLKLCGFFRAPAVWKVIGPDQAFLDWLKLQPCAAKGHGECEGQVVPAHVRRVADGAGTGIKPPYSAIPLCFHHHEQQHQYGEQALGGREWFEKKRIDYVEAWAWQSIREHFNIESMSQLDPELMIAWAVENSVDNYLPANYDIVT